MKVFSSVALVILLLSSWTAAEEKSTSITGWRGNWTGRFPDATPVTNWSVRPKSPMDGLRYQAARPGKDDTGANAKEVWAGDVAQWLMLTGFNAKDATTALDEPIVPDEAALEPAAGDQVAGQEWKLNSQKDYQDLFTPENFKKYQYGPYGLGTYARFYDLIGDGTNTASYAHTYLYAKSAGKVCLILNHEDGLKAWLNGKEIYKSEKKARNFLAYEPRNDFKAFRVSGLCPRVDVDLKPGWNRLLLKLTKKQNSSTFSLRITAPAETEYATTNIKWMTRLPAWSLSSPIVVGNRVFVTSEPDELVCINRADGKILWRRANTLYDATTEAERAGNPIFAEIAPLATELAKGAEQNRATELRGQITKLLYKIDPQPCGKYDWVSKNGHLTANGYTLPTPVSDGQFVYAYLTPGVVVCYDLEGNRQWIQNIMDMGIAKDSHGKLRRTFQDVASPCLSGDRLIVDQGNLRAFDKKTGKIAWDTGILEKGYIEAEGGIPDFTCNQSCVPFRLNGTDFVLGDRGRIVRTADGKLMQSSRIAHGNAWTTPVVEGDMVYFWGVGKQQMTIKDDMVVMTKLGAIDLGSNITDFLVSSPLIDNGLIYTLSPYGILNVTDTDTLKLVYSQRLEMWPRLDFDHIGATASVVLGGKYIYLLDNQGICVVIEPGRTFKQVAYNRMDMLLQHPWPVGTRERTPSAPVFAGKDIFIRGEKYLYCIGAEK